MVSTRRSTAQSGVALRAAAQRPRQPRRPLSTPQRLGVPTAVEALLAEVGEGTEGPEGPEPPRKRLKRPGEKPKVETVKAAEAAETVGDDDDDEGDDEDVEWEDIVLPEPVVQTVESDNSDDSGNDSDDDNSIDNDDFRSNNTSATHPPTSTDSLELNLSHARALLPLPRARTAARKKPLSRTDRARRLALHKVHLLCLLAHAARRNRWCRRPDVQAALRPLLTDTIVGYLDPPARLGLSQFGRTESLKKGLERAAAAFRARFVVTERGLRRPRWATEPAQLQAFVLPPDAETVLDVDDFVAAARTLRGSRDVGAQLFAALLRSVGLQTRLVCSLQPLDFRASAPTLARPTTATTIPARQRAAVPLPSAAVPLPSAAASPHVVHGESAFPVYWVEVLDVAHQKWQPVDPLVTATQWRPHRLEPPASDRLNQLAYAVAFAADGSAKDVTRRYAKAFNAKTRLARVDGPGGRVDDSAAVDPGGPPPRTGARWLHRALGHYRCLYDTDVDTIEDAELRAAEAREPMPRNVADFQHHPVFALARHLRRHEVLLPGATAVGTVSAGSKAPTERIYRRRDVRVAYTADKWYRRGRVVRPHEIPAKWLPKRKTAEEDEDEDERGDLLDALGHPAPNGVPAFTPEQTDLYQAPAVVDGRVPKNQFGNVDVYVPSMVPPGGVHIEDAQAVRAAFLLGVDYAPALTGFRFDSGAGGPGRGGRRRGTAVLRGAVVAAEHAEAVRAVLAGLADQEAAAAAERRTHVALRTWAALLRGLRIRARIRAAAEDRGEDVEGDVEGDVEEEDVAGGDDDDDDAHEPDDTRSDTTEEYDIAMEGGGFMPE